MARAHGVPYLLTWFALTLAPVASPAIADVPTWIASQETPETGRPLWVSAEEAVVDGRVRPDLFTESQVVQLQAMLDSARRNQGKRQSSSPCDVINYQPHRERGEAHPPKSAREYYDFASTILLGTIQDQRAGFLRGTPGTLYEVTVEHYVKARTKASGLPRTIYFFYRTAVIPVVGEVYLCSHAQRGMAQPEIGRRVVLLLEESLDGEDAQVLTPLDHEIVFELSDGSASLPVRYPQRDILTHQFAQSLLEAAAGGGS